MIKRIALILVFILLFPSVVNAEATDQRDLVEFLELYMYRYTQYALEKDLRIDLSTIPYYFNNIINSENLEYITFVSSAGEIVVESGSYLIHSLTMNLWSSSSSDDSDERKVRSCIIAISALEFDSNDELKSDLYRKYLNTNRTVIDDATDIFFDIIRKAGDDYQQGHAASIKTYICSYNYDYYIKYWSHENIEYVDLIAEKRK